jgi:hypothetical protein
VLSSDKLLLLDAHCLPTSTGTAPDDGRAMLTSTHLGQAQSVQSKPVNV